MAPSAEPWNHGRLGAPQPPAGWCHGSAGDVAGGCRIDCWLLAAGDELREVRFEVFASGEAMRAAAWLADWLSGRSLAVADGVTGAWLADAAGLPDQARGDGLLVEDALRAALTAMPVDGDGKAL